MRQILCIVLGCFLVAVGVVLLKHAYAITGGTAGLSLSLSYIFHIPFAYLFLAINLPFYVLSIMKMGWRFTLNSICSVTLLSFLSIIDNWLPAFTLPDIVSTVASGVFIGLGLILLFMNNASLGGANILALYLHKSFKIDPGKTNFIFDLIIVITTISSIGLLKGIYSILSIAITSMMISYIKKRIEKKNLRATRSTKSYLVTSKM